MDSNVLRLHTHDGTEFFVDADVWESEQEIQLSSEYFWRGTPSSLRWRAAVKPHTTYIVRTIESRHQIRLHRVVMSAGPGDVVDHIDHNGTNNSRSNLRLVTAAENARNRGVAKSSSGFKGVYKYDSTTYYAHIRVGGKKVHLGTFPTAKKAALAYDFAATAEFGEHASLNFPEVVQ